LTVSAASRLWAMMLSSSLRRSLLAVRSVSSKRVRASEATALTSPALSASQFFRFVDGVVQLAHRRSRALLLALWACRRYRCCCLL